MIAALASSAVEASTREWEELAERVQASPFLRPGWVAAWCKAFGHGRLEIRCERRPEDERLCALLPVQRERGTLATPTSWHSPEFGLLAESPTDARRLVAALLADRPRRVSLGFLAPQQAELARAEALAQGYRVLQRTLQRSPYVPIAGDWEAYLHGLSKGFRDDLARTRRLLCARGEVRFQVSAGAELDLLLEQGFSVEASGWKGARGTAIRSRAAERRFYTEVARWAAARGWLRLAFLRLDGRPLAFDFCLEHAGVHYLIKTGYDPAFRELGPGKLLRAEMLARAFREGLRSYEFLGDAEPWKLRWASATRARELVQLFRPTPLGLVDWSLFHHGRPLALRLRDLVRGRAPARVALAHGASAPPRAAGVRRESGVLAPQPRIGQRSLALLELLDTRRSNLLRVLAYGRVTEAAPFERQMEYLAARHPVVSAAQVLDALEAGHALPPRAVLLVFRDERSFAAVVGPVLARRGFAAVLFVSSARAPDAQLRALARQGLEIGVSGRGRRQAQCSARAALITDLRSRWRALEDERFGPPRLFAYSDGRPNEEEVEAVRAAGTELAFTALPGANDLRRVDPMRLRCVQVDGHASLSSLRARLVLSSPRWSWLGGRAGSVTPEERQRLRTLHAGRARLRFVNRTLDAVLTAGECPRPAFTATLRALARRSSNYERLRNVVGLTMHLEPARRIQRALLDTTRFSLRATGIEPIGHGTAATVFGLLGEPGRVAHVLKVYRWTLGQSGPQLLQMARRHRARYLVLRRWLGESVLPAHFLVLHGPLRGLAVAACVQERIGHSTDLLALTDEKLLQLLRSRPELRAEFVAFGQRLFELRAQGFFPDLLGAGNLVLVEHAESARIRLIDYGLFDLRLRASHRLGEALRTSVRRFELLVRELVPTQTGA